MSEQQINSFVQDLYIPTLHRIAEIRRLQEEFEPTVIVSRPTNDVRYEQLLTRLDQSRKGPAAPALVVHDRVFGFTHRVKIPSAAASVEGPAANDVQLAGVFATSVSFAVERGEVFAEPLAGFWMAFNGRVHLFADYFPVYQSPGPGIAPQRPTMSEIAAHDIYNHFQNSFYFFRRYALEDQPFPGYRGSNS